MANHFSIGIEGLDEMLDDLLRIENGVPRAVENALVRTHEIVTPLAEAAIAPHRRTGRTAKSIYESPYIEWESPLVAFIHVGFAIRGWGLASIFLMHGTPRMAPDPAFRAAFYGHDEEIAAAQQEEFEKVITGG
jgi:hypothetical protein